MSKYSARSGRQQTETETGDLLDEARAAAYIGVQPRCIRSWRAARGLPYLRVTNKVVRIRRSDLDGWLDSHRVSIVA